MISRRKLIENQYRRSILNIHNNTDKLYFPQIDELTNDLSDLITYFTLHFIDYNEQNKINKITKILELLDITINEDDKNIIYKEFNNFILWFKNLN